MDNKKTLFKAVLISAGICCNYAKAVLKFVKLNTVAQQREAVTRGRSLLPYRLRYNLGYLCFIFHCLHF
ncbi:MAG: hypothetical protein LBL62_04345 [Planctomycetaceae bacterium]|nr:hypothetical protein [Planctomycetaceae bacterium]